MGTVTKLKPKVYDRRHYIMNVIAERIYASGKTYQQIAKGVGVSPSTINNIASGKTRWPRPATLFGLLSYFGLTLTVEKL